MDPTTPERSASDEQSNGSRPHSEGPKLSNPVPPTSTPAEPLSAQSAQIGLNDFFDTAMMIGGLREKVKYLNDTIRRLEERGEELGEDATFWREKYHALSVEHRLCTPQQASTAVPSTPSQASHVVTPSSTMRRHGRTETPDTNKMNAIIASSPAPQGDRGLLKDYFDNLSAWAGRWASYNYINLSDGQVLGVLSAAFQVSDWCLDPATVIADTSLRPAFIAAIVIRETTRFTLSEHFMAISGHSKAGDCEKLLRKWDRTPIEDVEKRIKILDDQKYMYEGIKQYVDHKTWRANKSQELATGLCNNLGPLISRERPDVSMMELKDLVVKGYRIGFRMRSESHKWSLIWPQPQDSFDANTMMNAAVLLLGNPSATLFHLTHSPEKFEIRFAKSPSISKIGYQSAVENNEKIHNAEVMLGPKASFFSPELNWRRRSLSGDPSHRLPGPGPIEPLNGKRFCFE